MVGSGWLSAKLSRPAEARRWARPFELDVPRRFVLAQTLEGGMAEHAIACPAGEGHLRYELGLDTSGAAQVLARHGGEGRAGALDLTQPIGELTADGQAEASACLAREDQLAAIVEAEEQRSQLTAGLVRSHPAADDDLLPVEAFDLGLVIAMATAIAESATTLAPTDAATWSTPSAPGSPATGALMPGVTIR
jgi:hypothetical protein